MAKNLVIVESPAKAKTISKFLGKEFTVESSMGHIRDLPRGKDSLTDKEKKLKYALLGVDIKDSFKPLYVVPVEKRKIATRLKSLVGKNTTIWVATDEDREGEAIGWHLIEVLRPKKTNKINRIVFHEITREAILKAIENPRKIDKKLVDAQQARRILDRLVGYKLSPFLWRKIRAGLSAGRVQSVAVKLIVDRDDQIKLFKAEEYYEVLAQTKTKENKDLLLKLVKIGDKTVNQMVNGKNSPKKLKNPLKNKEADKIIKELKKEKFIITEIIETDKKSIPPPPFITSSLQREASNRLGFSVKKTMKIAQDLYEGISGRSGLITYMRTDSLNLSAKAIAQTKKVIQKEYGEDYALSYPRIYKKKVKGAQEAHEAVRPTSVSLLPSDAKGFLKEDHYKLYNLVWRRTVATQMKEAVFGVTKIIIKIGKTKKYFFVAKGIRIKFSGYTRAWVNSTKENILPLVKKGDELALKSLEKKQNKTKPPARYTEASLVKKLETEGIGRPSTYAPTISTIINRGYIEKQEKFLVPTDTAEVVTKLLKKHFSDIVDTRFTAEMEEGLDSIAEGKKKWVPFIKDFYNPFSSLLERKKKEVKREDIVNEKTKEKCDKCGKPMVVKLSRFGKFLSCSDYPNCKNAKSLNGNDKEAQIMEKKYSKEKCDKCGEPMIIKQGRFGEFLACSAYPKCKTTKSIEKGTGVKCPVCGEGEMIERRSRKGRIFYGCNKYPKCQYALWNKPSKKSCPKCGGIQVIKGKAQKVVCENCNERKK